MYITVRLRAYDGSYAGRAYSYKTELPLQKGDKVIAPTFKGPVDGIVEETDVPETAIEPRFLPKLKEITEYAEEEADA